MITVESGDKSKIIERKKCFTFLYQCSTPILCDPYTITMNPGVYLFEAWGAQGGNSSIYYNGDLSPNPAEGGKGGYSVGKILILNKTKAFVYVGSGGFVLKEANKNSSGAFNGGGAITVPLNQISGHGTSGGGASDIRLISNSYYHRVIVAAGGGGASGGSNNIQRIGGSGGGEVGSNGYHDSEIIDPSWWSQGANQTSAGIYSKGEADGSGFPGQFGVGGTCTNIYNGNNYGGSGGGGWFGGAGGAHRTPGAGGSGFVFTSNSKTPNEYKLDNSFHLFDATTINGNFSFPSPILTKNETGHSGNGVVRITIILSQHCLHSFHHKMRETSFLFMLAVLFNC